MREGGRGRKGKMEEIREREERVFVWKIGSREHKCMYQTSSCSESLLYVSLSHNQYMGYTPQLLSTEVR